MMAQVSNHNNYEGDVHLLLNKENVDPNVNLNNKMNDLRLVGPNEEFGVENANDDFQYMVVKEGDKYDVQLMLSYSPQGERNYLINPNNQQVFLVLLCFSCLYL